MSFAVSRNKGEFEWAGGNLSSVFTQRWNILPFGTGLKVWWMLYDIFKFHKQATSIAETIDLIEFEIKDDSLKQALLKGMLILLTISLYRRLSIRKNDPGRILFQEQVFKLLLRELYSSNDGFYLVYSR